MPIALLPASDTLNAGVPVDRITGVLATALAAHGFELVPSERVEAVLRAHRERSVSGVSGPIAAALGAEAGARTILVTSVDDWDGGETPRVALTARLVGATPEAPILWVDGTAHHALEKPGAFGLGLGKSADELLAIAADELAASIERGPTSRKLEKRFLPRSLAATAPGEISSRRRVAVLPFFTDGPDRGLGDLLALQFVRHLAEDSSYEVVEPGVVRQALLDTRVIQEDGVSLAQVDTVRALLDIDIVVSGRITQYDPLGLSPGSPSSGFSARAIDARTRRVIWTSFSYAEGDDGLRWFDTRWVRSGVLLTSELVRGVLVQLEKTHP